MITKPLALCIAATLLSLSANSIEFPKDTADIDSKPATKFSAEKPKKTRKYKSVYSSVKMVKRHNKVRLKNMLN